MRPKTKAKIKNRFLTVRLSPVLHRRFVIKCQDHDSPSFVIREMVAAFVEDRIRITPSNKGLYHVD